MANPTLNYYNEIIKVLARSIRLYQYCQPLNRLLSPLCDFQKLLLSTPTNIPNNNVLYPIHQLAICLFCELFHGHPHLSSSFSPHLKIMYLRLHWRCTDVRYSNVGRGELVPDTHNEGVQSGFGG
jgi:hypothetical protein